MRTVTVAFEIAEEGDGARPAPPLVNADPDLPHNEARWLVDETIGQVERAVYRCYELGERS